MPATLGILPPHPSLPVSACAIHSALWPHSSRSSRSCHFSHCALTSCFSLKSSSLICSAVSLAPSPRGRDCFSSLQLSIQYLWNLNASQKWLAHLKLLRHVHTFACLIHHLEQFCVLFSSQLRSFQAVFTLSHVKPFWAIFPHPIWHYGPRASNLLLDSRPGAHVEVIGVNGLYGPILGLCWPSWGQRGPILGLCWPILGLCWPILDPILGLGWPILGLYVGPSCTF